jgi:uncharacterized protein YkwD
MSRRGAAFAAVWVGACGVLSATRLERSWQTGLGPSRAAAATPPRWLTPDEARRWMLELINRDRASVGLGPVELDASAAQSAGQSHAEDMAARGFLSHWGSDGSVPEQRYTEAGGVDMVMENVSCFTDGRARSLDDHPRIDSRKIEAAEAMFFHEVPPNDGHRQNIVKPWHKRVGIGVAQPAITPTEIPVPCIAQEFVDSFGAYGPLPRAAAVGSVVHVSGTVDPPASFVGVGIARIDAPTPLSVAALASRHSYPIPSPYEMLWRPGYRTPIPVRVSGGSFAVDVPMSEGGRPGLYEVSVWASMPGANRFVMVSLRTVRGDLR